MKRSSRVFSKRAMLFQVVRHTASYRRRSEDRVAIHEAQGGVVIALADGAGGWAGGGPAAERFMLSVASALADPTFDPQRAAAWASFLRRADGAIERDARAGQTTAVVVAVFADHIVGASAGDSGARIVFAGGCDELTAEQERRLRLGTGRAEPVAFERGALEGTLIVASDGLFAHASDDAIRASLGAVSLEQAAINLVDAARTPRGQLPDDVALAMVVRARSDP